MARYDRGMAQRYAARKRKKRPAPGRPSAAVGEPVRTTTIADDLEDEVEAAAPLTVAPPLPAVRISRAPVADARRTALRKRFAD